MGADAICDPLAVKPLLDVYRAAMRLQPFADPGFLDVEQVRVSQQGTSKQGTGKHGSGGAPSDAMTQVDLQRDVPSGWFHAGTREQVPGDAVYAGHSGASWVWVTPDKVADLRTNLDAVRARGADRHPSRARDLVSHTIGASAMTLIGRRGSRLSHPSLIS